MTWTVCWISSSWSRSTRWPCAPAGRWATSSAVSLMANIGMGSSKRKDHSGEYSRPSLNHLMSVVSHKSLTISSLVKKYGYVCVVPTQLYSCQIKESRLKKFPLSSFLCSNYNNNNCKTKTSEYKGQKGHAAGKLTHKSFAPVCVAIKGKEQVTWSRRHLVLTENYDQAANKCTSWHKLISPLICFYTNLVYEVFN